MNKLLSISGLAVAAALAFAGNASAADMPVKAAPLPPAVYDWSGIYAGFHEGYLWGSVHDVCSTGCVPAGFTEDSTVRNAIAGFHVGLQKQFGGLPFGSWVAGLEGGLNAPLGQNSNSNFGPCAGAAFSCGVRNFRDNWYAGGRLGLAWNWGGGGWLFGGDYLLTVQGGWTTANFVRQDFTTATGVVCGGGTCFTARHNGGYVGAGLEHVWAKGVLVDWISGIDYQHEFFGSQGNLDPHGATHTLSADVDIVRLRTTLKFH